ncbi:hypothetical protein L1049_017822 [Liquidambar formosana]|uniref:Uncharacterized protein n=1 Tax=Liquidambar formosana TaxID=63359 RepID=A0AAP0R821_LIQFO
MRSRNQDRYNRQIRPNIQMGHQSLKHKPTNSSVGVCASCLRERLFSLIAAQAQAQVQVQAQLRSAAAEDRLKSDPHPPPLIFPRSVSPYISRRKADDTSWYHHQHHLHSVSNQRFYSTPQVGPGGSITTAGSLTKKRGKFSLISKLFRSRSEKLDLDPRASRDSCTTSSSSPSWFPSIFSGRRKKRSTIFSGDRGPYRTRNRGMSLERAPDDGDECDASSGYSSESSQGWKRTPVAVPVTSVRRGRPGHVRNTSGLAFCLSPLVRASPNRHWNQKCMPPEIGFSGEFRVSAKPHLSTAASFCANRSRKLADFGRGTPNR